MAALLRDFTLVIFMAPVNRQISITVNSDIKFIIRLKKYLLLIDGLILVSLFSAEAQNLSQTMDFASRQYQKGNTDEAISLYQRVLFFDSLNIHSFEACRNLASCYISVDNNSKAREFSRMAGNLAPTDSLKNEQIFQLAYLYLAEDDYNYALIELLGLRESGSGYFQMKRNQMPKLKKWFQYQDIFVMQV